jgi:hypothetical protein
MRHAVPPQKQAAISTSGWAKAIFDKMDDAMFAKATSQAAQILKVENQKLNKVTVRSKMLWKSVLIWSWLPSLLLPSPAVQLHELPICFL